MAAKSSSFILFFSVLNLKGFGEGRKLEHLVPNQIQNVNVIEVCWNLLISSD